MATPALLLFISFPVFLAGYVLGCSYRPEPTSKVKSLEDQLQEAQTSRSRYLHIAIKAIKSRDLAIKKHAELRDQIIEDTMNTDYNEVCDLPPKGWYCTRAKGHDGPCAAIPSGETGPAD